MGFRISHKSSRCCGASHSVRLPQLRSRYILEQPASIGSASFSIDAQIAVSEFRRDDADLDTGNRVGARHRVLVLAWLPRVAGMAKKHETLSLIHISEPTRLLSSS